METIDITIIGAGVVGLAIAARLARPGRTLAVLEKNQGADWAIVGPEIFRFIYILIGFYILSLLSSFTYNRAMAVITQGCHWR
jgi:thioredoxin reductase